jgi:hypothetical protein
MIIYNNFFSCSKCCGNALDARNNFTRMMLIFWTTTLEYHGERKYIILAIIGCIFRWTQQIVCKLMVHNDVYGWMGFG